MRIPKLNFKSILLYYSAIFSAILIIGGFYSAHSIKEIISNLLFLPIVIFLWITLIQHRQQVKNEVKSKVKT
ncbi:MAG: hypothetical protein ACK413_03400 [Patescibacteria group bacterium]